MTRAVKQRRQTRFFTETCKSHYSRIFAIVLFDGIWIMKNGDYRNKVMLKEY